MAEGGSADGAFLVAADGLWSRLRVLLAPGARLEATGVTAARCVLSMDAVPRRFHAPATGIWLAPDSHVVHYPVAGGRSLAIVAIAPVAATASGWNTAVDAAAVIARFPHLPPALGELFERAETWRQWGLMRGGMTFRPEGGAAGPGNAPAMLFLGDAAHPIQPFLAQGGAMAIEDAAVFADLFAAGPGAAASLATRFETLRRPRIERVRAASIENGRIYHLSGLARTMRNTALRLTPGAAMIRRYDWLYGWRADA
jgi:salicylate hydroxylase